MVQPLLQLGVDRLLVRLSPDPSADRPLQQLRCAGHGDADAVRLVRSEEHTSELQSRLHLVCRLLLEKKKKKKKNTTRDQKVIQFMIIFFILYHILQIL